MSDIAVCASRIELDADQVRWLASLPMPAHGLERVLSCNLDQGHAGPHASLGQYSRDTEWWVQWTLSVSEINPIPACPVTRTPDQDEDDNVCLLYAGHPGRHLYGTDRQ